MTPLAALLLPLAAFLQGDAPVGTPVRTTPAVEGWMP